AGAAPAATAAARLPAAAVANATPAPAAPAAGGGTALPGLSVTAVGAELVAYFGEGSERGLLVLQADSSWAPIKTGDVIMSINGAPVTAQRLRSTLTSRRQSAVELLRRKRPLTVALPARG
ncbi:MAG TPA: hypothetical protein VKA84_26005, partial [Gemmatimonadaceae bacterium]|nr:hypothetical protein [Gemmatimonadaceae bacterium]